MSTPKAYDYTIVRAESSKELQHTVVGYMRHGWHIVGRAFTDNGMWFQTMVLYERE